MADTPPGLPSDPDKPRQRKRTFPVYVGDWMKLREMVTNLKEPVPYLASVGWTCVGLTVAALLSLLGWLPINSALPVKAHTRYTFVTPLLIITAVAGTVIVGFTFTVWHQVKRIRVTTVKNVQDHMDAIYRPYSHTKS
jgi:hypothetical protein